MMFKDKEGYFWRVILDLKEFNVYKIYCEELKLG